jgi:hypothetical protein
MAWFLYVPNQIVGRNVILAAGQDDGRNTVLVVQVEPAQTDSAVLYKALIQCKNKYTPCLSVTQKLLLQ